MNLLCQLARAFLFSVSGWASGHACRPNAGCTCAATRLFCPFAATASPLCRTRRVPAALGFARRHCVEFGHGPWAAVVMLRLTWIPNLQAIKCHGRTCRRQSSSGWRSVPCGVGFTGSNFPTCTCGICLTGWCLWNAWLWLLSGVGVSCDAYKAPACGHIGCWCLERALLIVDFLSSSPAVHE